MQEECLDFAMIASFRILPNSIFINHPTIRRCMFAIHSVDNDKTANGVTKYETNIKSDVWKRVSCFTPASATAVVCWAVAKDMTPVRQHLIY
jgi:hypothetical protein